MPYAKLLKKMNSRMDAESAGTIDFSAIDLATMDAENEIRAFDDAETAVSLLASAERLYEVKGSLDTESAKHSASTTIAVCIAKACLLDAESAGYLGIRDTDTEGEKMDKAKNWLKVARDNVIVAIQRIIDIGKKYFLQVSAWFATNDKLKKDILKKLDDNGKHKDYVMKDDLKTDGDKFKTFAKAHQSLLRDHMLIDKINTNIIKDITVNGNTVTDLSAKLEAFAGSEPDGMSSDVEKIFNDDDTVKSFAGAVWNKLFVVLYNESYVDPEDENDTDPNAVYAVVKYDIEDKVFTNGVDTAVEGLYTYFNKNKATLKTEFSKLESASKVQSNIDKAMKIFDDVKKDADKEFGKDPSEVADKQKRMAMIKNSLIARSKAAYGLCKYDILKYKTTLEMAKLYTDNLVKKKSNSNTTQEED